MGNAHINLLMGNSQGRDMGLNCLTMEIVYWTTFNVSTLNGQWTSIGHPLIASTLNGQLDILYLGRKGDKKIQ